MDSLLIPADYCLGLIDAAAYPSFVDSNWTPEQLRGHFVSQMNQGTMLAWGTNAPGNWRIAVNGSSEIRGGYREFRGHIRATGSKLHLTSYDELTAAAQFEDVKLPRKGTEGWFISVAAGEYDCQIVQLYDPMQAESEEVFNQVTPHFALAIWEAKAGRPNEFKQVPWFTEL